MTEKRRQVPIRVSSEVYRAWSDAASASGASLNQFVTDSVQARLGAPLGAFAAQTATPAEAPSTAAVLTKFDEALAESPFLTGLHRWVNPDVLRENFVTKLA